MLSLVYIELKSFMYSLKFKENELISKNVLTLGKILDLFEKLIQVVFVRSNREK